jgi:hypothetical protein
MYACAAERSPSTATLGYNVGSQFGCWSRFTWVLLSENMRAFLHRRIGLFYYRKQQEKIYNYFTVYYTYVCPTRTSALTEVDVSSIRSEASWHLQDRVVLKLLPQNVSKLLKSFLICATTMSPHDVMLALAFNHDTDWLPVTFQQLAQNVTHTISNRIIFTALYRLKL